MGAILGSTLGYMSWKILEKYKNGFNEFCKNNAECKKEEENISTIRLLTKNKYHQTYEIISKSLVLIPVVFLLCKFFVVDFHNLTQVKH